MNLFKRTWLRMRSRDISMQERMIESGSQIMPPVMTPYTSGQMEGLFALNETRRDVTDSEVQTLEGRRAGIEGQVGIEPPQAAHTGEELAKDVDEHADSLAKWREEDERNEAKG